MTDLLRLSVAAVPAQQKNYQTITQTSKTIRFITRAKTVVKPLKSVTLYENKNFN